MTYGWEFHHLLNKACQGEDVATIDAYLERQEKDFPQDGYRMYFIDNHDENSWNGTVEKRIGANAQAAYVICATMEQGMPLIYSGQEVGLNKSLRFFERDTIDWSRPSQADFYAKVSALKHKNPALNSGDFGGAQKRITTGNPRVYAFSRATDGNSVVVFTNFDAAKAEVTYSGAPAGTYTNHFTGESFELAEGGTLSLPAHGFLVLTK
jgi:glycosidase